jgi:asparagine N-glycosylation enzyme membrane subunit Stt3
MRPSRVSLTIRGLMAVVGASALILTLVAWPVLAGVTLILVLFSPMLSECYKGVRRLKSSSRVVSQTRTQIPWTM